MPWWDTDYTTWLAQSEFNMVALWPLPGSDRVDARFKMLNGDPPCVSRAMRHIFTWKPFPGGERYFALIDVAYDGVPGELVGETGSDPDGRNMELKITDYQFGNPHPDYSEVGIGYLFTLSLPGTTDWHIEWFFPQEDTEFSGPAKVSLSHKFLDPCKCKIQNDDFDPGTAWEALDASPIEWYTLSECTAADGEEKVFTENFARFNGFSSYIALTNKVAAFNNPFVVECDFRWQGQLDWAPIWGIEASGGFFGFDKTEVIFGNLRLNTSWAPIIGKWYHYEYRFEQSGQLGHQQLIDDIIVMDAVTARQFMAPNRLGVYRRTVPGTLWAHCDVKFLTYRKGTPGAFATQLDMPLQVNALDVGPFANHGTTFNMELPSV